MSIHSAYIPNTDTICALSTAPGTGAIAVIRASGPDTFPLMDKIFRPARKNITMDKAATHTAWFGTLNDDNSILDEVVVTIYRGPHSYTGDDVAEISCHGSVFIQQKVLELLISQGMRLAQPGEFTLRAFRNGRLDLSQAEAVADLIASHSQTSHDLAIEQMRGGFSSKIKQLRSQLVQFASLLELELDFSEEEVEFADRSQFKMLLSEIEQELRILVSSFSTGNVLKKGIPVAIIGKPNVGKSTLLNALLNEERAIVSDIPGTTRDVIEDSVTHEGVTFRFIDTAGLRDSDDTIEAIGIERTHQMIRKAMVVLYLFDIRDDGMEEINEVLDDFKETIEDENKHLILIGNKTDTLVEAPRTFKNLVELETIFISAKRKENINLILQSLLRCVDINMLADQTVVSNARHYQALTQALDDVSRINTGLESNIPSDLIAQDVRQAMHHLGEITGEITTNEILGNIFSKFCIGK